MDENITTTTWWTTTGSDIGTMNYGSSSAYIDHIAYNNYKACDEQKMTLKSQSKNVALMILTMKAKDNGATKLVDSTKWDKLFEEAEKLIKKL